MKEVLIYSFHSLVPLQHKQASQLSISQQLAIGFVTSLIPASPLTALVMNDSALFS
jgi:hypothetical protein